MRDKIRRGFLRHILSLPGILLEKGAEKGRERITEELAFVTEEHRKVHHFVVRELPIRGGPLAPDLIARETGLSMERTAVILQELEENMTFLFRDEKGEVAWAYPVTAEETPHPVTFSTGEQIYSA